MDAKGTSHRDVFVKLNATPTSFHFPKTPAADPDAPANSEGPRPHDPFVDNGIPVPYFIRGSAAAKDEHTVRCHNDLDTDLQTPSRQADRVGSSISTERQPFFALNPTEGLHACWWCCHGFPTASVGIPTGMSGDPPSETLPTYGFFCSYSCALAWAMEKRAFHKHIPLLHYLHKRSNNTFCVESAPPRETLRMFGGALSIDDFRAATLIAKPRPRFSVIETPTLVPLRMYVEDLSQSTQESTSIVQVLRKKAARGSSGSSKTPNVPK
jgi:hypothetical protein